MAQLQKEAAPLLVAAENGEASPSSSSSSLSPASSSSPASSPASASLSSSPPPPSTLSAEAKPTESAPAPLSGGAVAAVAAAVAAAVEHWTAAALQPGVAAAAADPEGGGTKPAEGRGAAGGEEVACRPLVSTLLVAPRLHPFNAAKFDSFARNLAIALKQAPIMDRIEVEVYHPELVCDGGIVDLDRRSPYPTLLFTHCGLKEVLFEPSGKFRCDFGRGLTLATGVEGSILGSIIQRQYSLLWSPTLQAGEGGRDSRPAYRHPPLSLAPPILDIDSFVACFPGLYVCLPPLSSTRHTLPPLKLPLDDASDGQDIDGDGNSDGERDPSSAPGSAGEVSADDAQL